ncbi:MAG: cysteine--tRNA ligase [Bacilli bacterium]|nr:cysteine--tRNA ligase [Bacilli bacterium]
MDIKFYNSLTNTVEPFHTLQEGKVSMYVCGPTVYNYPHIGNMRPVVVFDILRRFLTYVGYEVTYVSNFTDVDDKIINASIKENKTEKELTEFFIDEFKKTTNRIGSQVPTITPKVTEYIDKIIAYVAKLVELDAAYVVNGNVYFRVSKIKDYGALSGINTEDLIAGARIEENSEKESPLDFALWKKTDVGISWDSPWGKGRPGWHTECCVMIDTIFPDHFIDIHGGGYDLKFPHHENEIAQAEAMHGNKIANYWMHNAFINFGGEKMSKSLGNVVYAKDMIDKFTGPVTRLVILNTHYRMPVNYTDETIEAARQEISKMTNAYKQLSLLLQANGYDLNTCKPAYIDKFLLSLADDLNTANALMELYSLIKEANQLMRSRELDLHKLGDIFKTLTDMFNILGLDIPFKALTSDELKLYQDYLALKKEKRFEESDVLRNQLMEKGIL